MRITRARLALVLMLGVWLLGPVLENVDPWDMFPDTGDSILLTLTALAACFGGVLSLALLIALALTPLAAAAPILVPRAAAEAHSLPARAQVWLLPPRALRI